MKVSARQIGFLRHLSMLKVFLELNLRSVRPSLRVPPASSICTRTVKRFFRQTPYDKLEEKIKKKSKTKLKACHPSPVRSGERFLDAAHFPPPHLHKQKMSQQINRITQIKYLRHTTQSYDSPPEPSRKSSIALPLPPALIASMSLLILQVDSGADNALRYWGLVSK